MKVCCHLWRETLAIYLNSLQCLCSRQELFLFFFVPFLNLWCKLFLLLYMTVNLETNLIHLSFLVQEIHAVWNSGLLASGDDWGENSWWKGGLVESGCPLLRVPGWKTSLWSEESRGDLPQDIEGKQRAVRHLAKPGIKKIICHFCFAFADLHYSFL